MTEDFTNGRLIGTLKGHRSLAVELAGVFDHPLLHLVKDAGHWPQNDQPDVVAKLIAQPADVLTRRGER
jgi:hypothetical protein